MEKEISYNQIVQNIKLIYSSGKLSDYLILAGGIVPYLIFNQNSNRLHSDIDFICKIEDIDKIKDIFTSYGYYEREFDSLNILKKDNYLDFIIPQLYYGFFNETKPYITVLNEFSNMIKTSNTNLKVGLSIYKSGNVDTYAKSGKNEWIENNNILNYFRI